MSDFLNKFNKEQQGKLFIRLNEISSKGEGHKAHNILKGKIDERKLRVEPKGLEAYEISNYANYIGFSNHKDTMIIENSDRRFVCIAANNRMCNNRKYFAPIWAEIADKGAMMDAFDYFNNLDVETFIVEPLPNTQYKEEQKLNNLPSAYRFLIDAMTEKGADWQIAARDIYPKYQRWSEEAGERATMRKTFVAKLKDIGYVSKNKRGISGKQQKVFTIEIDEFEKTMCQHLKTDQFAIERCTPCN
jgi:hypothetical protein